VNVGFVLDRSGSMHGERKFGLPREAVEQAMRLLRPEDRFTLVVYDQAVDVLAPAWNGDPELEAVRQSLRDDVNRYAVRAMSPMQLKAAMYVAESESKGRGRDGRARRAP